MTALNSRALFTGRECKSQWPTLTALSLPLHAFYFYECVSNVVQPVIKGVKNELPLFFVCLYLGVAARTPEFQLEKNGAGQSDRQRFRFPDILMICRSSIAS